MLDRNELARNLQDSRLSRKFLQAKHSTCKFLKVTHSTRKFLQVNHLLQEIFKILQINHLLQETCKFLQVNNSESTRELSSTIFKECYLIKVRKWDIN